MTKKISLLVAAVAVLVVAAPASASAHKVTEGGSLVSIGTKFLATSTNLSIQTAIGLLKCEKVVIEGELTKNNGTEVEGKGLGTGTTTGCKVGIDSATVSDLTVSSLKATAAGTTIKLTLKFLVTGIECHIGGLAPFTYTSGSSVINIVNANLAGVPEPICQPVTLNANFSITTTNGTALILQ